MHNAWCFLISSVMDHLPVTVTSVRLSLCLKTTDDGSSVTETRSLRSLHWRLVVTWAVCIHRYSLCVVSLYCSCTCRCWSLCSPLSASWQWANTQPLRLDIFCWLSRSCRPGLLGCQGDGWTDWHQQSTSQACTVGICQTSWFPQQLLRRLFFILLHR